MVRGAITPEPKGLPDGLRLCDLRKVTPSLLFRFLAYTARRQLLFSMPPERLTVV